MISFSVVLMTLLVLGIFVLTALACGGRTWGGSGRRLQGLLDDLKNGRLRGYAVLAAAVAMAMVIQLVNLYIR